MSAQDSTILINANYGNLSRILASEQSLFENRGYDTTNIFAVDNTALTRPIGQQANFSQEDRFRLRKRGGRIHHCWLKVQISAGVVAAANRAAYVDNLGEAMLEGLRVEYASKTIHQYNGEAIKAQNRLMYHDVGREAYNAMVFGNLPPGAGGAEAAREANVSAATLVFIPLDWLWFNVSEDYALTPEGLASELDVIVKYRNLEQLIYARVIATGLTPAGDPFTTRPAITQVDLVTQLIFEPKMQKTLNLAQFDTPQGQLFKILDFEEQRQQVIDAAAGTYNIKLDNFRLDSHFIMFFIRDSLVNTSWAIDRMQSDTTATILPGGGSVAALQPLTSFRLKANGSIIVDTCTDIENRAVWRKMYFPGSQIGEPIYFIPFGWLLKDKRNVTGFQNISNLGSVEVEIVMPARARQSLFEGYNVCHNAIQQKQGDIIRALR